MRRANALGERIPALPVPAPGPVSLQLDNLVGVLPDGDRAVMTVQAVQRRGTLGDGSPVAVGDRVPVVFPVWVRPGAIADGAEVGAIGVVSGGVIYGIYVSVSDPAAG